MNNKDLFIKELSNRAEKTRTPFRVLFELTGRCNFDCKMCYVHFSDCAQAKKEELSTEQWKDVFEEAVSAGMMFAVLSGGECLIRPDFQELYLFLFSRGIRIHINTNGFLLNESMITFFRRFPPEGIQVSLYGTTDEEYVQATGIQAFSVIRANLELLASSGLKFSIAITPSEASKPFVQHIIDFVERQKYQYNIVSMYLNPRAEVMNSPDQLTNDDICSFLEYSAMLKGKKLHRISLENLPEPGRNGEYLTDKRHCTAGLNNAQIDWRGMMHPCVALQSISCSVLNYSYSEAWRYICSEIDKLQYPAKCYSCCYKNVCKPCYAARGLEENFSLCNDQTCELIKLKVSRGLLRPDFLIEKKNNNSLRTEQHI